MSCCHGNDLCPKIDNQNTHTGKSLQEKLLRDPRLLARVDPTLLQMMPKLQILPDKGNVTFNNNNNRKRFRVLNFPRAAILDFMTSLRCPIVFQR